MFRGPGTAGLWTLVTVVWAGAAGGAETIPPQPVNGTIAWVYRYDEGQRLARASGKPLFVVFRCER
jgi:hypothetical protein